ncbi:hypothetical protein GCM10009680_23530 [Streptomyces yatensis]|uniref:Transposase n=1 Tax=Streptomyces yatensis TaxID=155177 RepID=A0ABN2H7E2_9ACTN
MVGITCSQLGGVTGKPWGAGESGGVKSDRRTRHTGSELVALLSNVENATTTGAGSQDKGR